MGIGFSTPYLYDGRGFWMRFIHIADVHLGAEPEGLNEGGKVRGQEIWESMEKVIACCEKEQTDLLLIAGDLFHRQPLMRELKELNYMFSKLSKTKVVFVVGNHDYLKLDSYYRTFAWNENVYPILSEEIDSVTFPELKTAVYGLSYYQKEITGGRYDHAKAPRKQKYEVLLAHGGDEKHIPIKKETLAELGYDYIAMGHIHKPQTVLENVAVYAGSLEPTDKNDIGPHGFVRGEIDEKGVSVTFIPHAKREYKHLSIEVDETMTNGAVKEKLRETIEAYGTEHMYQFTLKGFRDADIQFELEGAKAYGNVIEILDETQPSYDFEKLMEQNQGNLLGKFVESLMGSEEGSVEYQALFEGVQALVETKRG